MSVIVDQNKDIIELPYKQHICLGFSAYWQVLYRNTFKEILSYSCSTEEEADNYIAGLKGNKQ